MTRRSSFGSTFRKTRSVLYRSQRVMGDAEAFDRSPGTLAKRLVRRRVTRSIFRIFR
jgi:hypothetical protein